MKGLFGKSSAILLGLLLTFWARAQLIIAAGLANDPDVTGSEVYKILEKSKSRVPCVEVAILSDSVGRQMYDPQAYNAEIFSLASNQAIGLVGQFILANNFIEANRDRASHLKRVVLLSTPRSLSNELNQVYTYNYFLKPLFTREYLPFLDGRALGQISKLPLAGLSQIPIVKVSNWSPEFSGGGDEQFLLSALTIDYLLRIEKLCADNGLTFEVRGGFLSDLYRNHDFSAMRRQIQENGLDKAFAEYFQHLVFFPDSSFLDHVHLKNKNYFRHDPLKLETRTQ